MEACISVEISKKDFIDGKYKEYGEEVPDDKTVEKEMKDYLSETLFEICDGWCLRQEQPNIEYY